MARDTPGRIAILTATILILWFGGAAVGTLINAYPTFNEAVWDSIWHMIDPGALGDDENTKQRVLGSILAISGLIILAGAALTLFEELVERALGRLGAADPPVSVKGHLLVIGSNETLPALVTRVAAQQPAGPTATVVLVPPGEAAARQDLRRDLAAVAGGGEVLVVGGDLYGDGLERVCAADAAGIVVLADEIENRDASDLHVLGTGAALATALPADTRPPVSLQMHRGRNVDVVWDQFSQGFDALVEDRATAAIFALCLAHPAFADVFSGVDNRASVVFMDGFSGLPFGAVIDRHPELIPIAVARGAGAEIEPFFAPAPDRVVEAGERVVAFGDVDGAILGGGDDGARRGDGAGRGDGAPGVEPKGRADGAGRGVESPRFVSAARPHRLLIIGWSDAAESLVTELLDPSFVERLTVFDRTRPEGLPDRVGPLEPIFTSGRPEAPTDLERVVREVEPDRILVAATRATDATAAFVALRLERLFRAGAAGEARSADGQALREADGQARRAVPAIVVQQSDADRAGRLRLGLQHSHVVSSAELIAQTVAYSATSPETLATWEKMADGRLASIERLVVGPPSGSSDRGDGAAARVSFATVQRHLLADGVAPMALAREGRRLVERLHAGTVIASGDELLVVRRSN